MGRSSVIVDFRAASRIVRRAAVGCGAGAECRLAGPRLVLVAARRPGRAGHAGRAQRAQSPLMVNRGYVPLAAVDKPLRTDGSRHHSLPR
jgi:hypothetical protein